MPSDVEAVRSFCTPLDQLEQAVAGTDITFRALTASYVI
jgi:hypothetical protein